MSGSGRAPAAPPRPASMSPQALAGATCRERSYAVGRGGGRGGRRAGRERSLPVPLTSSLRVASRDSIDREEGQVSSTVETYSRKGFVRTAGFAAIVTV